MRKEAVIAHYDRMIAWVKTTRKFRQRPKMMDMLSSIGKYWYGEYCLYCKEYSTMGGCNDCPLHTDIVGEPSSSNRCCCNGLWAKMAKAKTWQTWLKYAEQVRAYIKKHGGKEI